MSVLSPTWQARWPSTVVRSCRMRLHTTMTAEELCPGLIFLTHAPYGAPCRLELRVDGAQGCTAAAAAECLRLHGERLSAEAREAGRAHAAARTTAADAAALLGAHQVLRLSLPTYLSTCLPVYLSTCTVACFGMQQVSVTVTVTVTVLPPASARSRCV
eukprot:1177923-Prorocentrum_minimum.AAC.2